MRKKRLCTQLFSLFSASVLLLSGCRSVPALTEPPSAARPHTSAFPQSGSEPTGSQTPSSGSDSTAASPRQTSAGIPTAAARRTTASQAAAGFSNRPEAASSSSIFQSAAAASSGIKTTAITATDATASSLPATSQTEIPTTSTEAAPSLPATSQTEIPTTSTEAASSPPAATSQTEIPTTSTEVTASSPPATSQTEIPTASTDAASSVPTASESPAPTTGSEIPPAIEVGDPDFKPGAYYKDSYPVLAFRETGDAVTYGAWWWYLPRLIQEDPIGVNVDMALDMLIANHISEIYLDIGAMIPWETEKSQGGLTEEDKAKNRVSELAVRGFVKKCHKYGIRVAALGGGSGEDTKYWIDPQYNWTAMHNLVNKVAAYNANAEDGERFYALRLDVEPHTIPEEKNAEGSVVVPSYWNNRQPYNQWLADLVIATRKECDRIGVELEWDIWAHLGGVSEDTVTDTDGAPINILEVYARECHTMSMMAYSKYGASQYANGTDLELAYAKKYGCRLIIASEMTRIDDEPDATYYFSPMEQTQAEAQALRQKIDESGYAEKMGGAVHHIRSFWEYMTAGQEPIEENGAPLAGAPKTGGYWIPLWSAAAFFGTGLAGLAVWMIFQRKRRRDAA